LGPPYNRAMTNIDAGDNDEARSYQLHFEQRPDYLYAHVSGPQDSPEITLAYWREIATECQMRRATRVMVMDDLGGAPTPPEQIAELVRKMQGSGMETVQIAFVEPIMAHVAMMEHGQIFAMESGFRAHVFSSVNAAERWLRFGGG